MFYFSNCKTKRDYSDFFYMVKQIYIFPTFHSPANRFNAPSSNRCTVHSSIGTAPMLR